MVSPEFPPKKPVGISPTTIGRTVAAILAGAASPIAATGAHLDIGRAGRLASPGEIAQLEIGILALAIGFDAYQPIAAAERGLAGAEFDPLFNAVGGWAGRPRATGQR